MSLQAGKYVFKGEYGCTFSPPLNAAHAGRTDLLGKLSNRKFTLQEYDKMLPFKAIDREEQYGIYGLALEPIDVTEAEATAGGRAEVDKCRAGTRSDILLQALDGISSNIPGNAWQIVQHRAPGGDLHTALHKLQNEPLNVETFVSYMRALSNLYRGLEVYHANNLVHLDIKAANIVLAGTVEHPDAFKYIDFGLSTSIESALAPNLTYLDRVYELYPRIANLWFHKMAFLSGRKVYDFNGNFDIRGFPFWQITEHHTFPTFLDGLVHKYKQQWTKDDFVEASRVLRLAYVPGSTSATADEMRTICARHADVYSLAIVTARILESVANVRLEYNTHTRVITTVDANPARGSIVALLPPTFFQRIGTLLYNMLNGRIVPDRRIAEQYDSVMSVFAAPSPVAIVAASGPVAPLEVASNPAGVATQRSSFNPAALTPYSFGAALSPAEAVAQVASSPVVTGRVASLTETISPTQVKSPAVQPIDFDLVFRPSQANPSSLNLDMGFLPSRANPPVLLPASPLPKPCKSRARCAIMGGKLRKSKSKRKTSRKSKKSKKSHRRAR